MENFVALIIVIIVSATAIIGFVFSYLGVKHFQKAQSKTQDKELSAIKWKLLFTGAILVILFFIGSLVYNTYFIFHSQTTIGKVVDIIESKDEDGSIYYYPIYKYSDKKGNIHQGKSQVGDGSGYLIGQKINLRYLIKNPSKSRVDDFTNIWSLSIFFGIFSIILTVWGFLLKLHYEKKFHR